MPNAKYLDTKTMDDSEYFSYTISPDCSSCDVSNNIEDNYLYKFNTDDYGDRTAYHMTGTIFGCLTQLKGNKDCVWDYDSYECSLCSRTTSDQGSVAIFLVVVHMLFIELALYSMYSGSVSTIHTVFTAERVGVFPMWIVMRLVGCKAMSERIHYHSSVKL